MPPQVTYAFALPGKTEKQEIFSLNWIVTHTQCTCALSSWKKKIVICDVFNSVQNLLR